jgi:hypothetical protein
MLEPIASASIIIVPAQSTALGQATTTVMSRGMAWPRARVPHAETKLAQYPLPLRWL